MFWSLNFSEGVSGHQLFFGDANFEIKIFSEFFPLPNALDSEFFTGGSRHQLFSGHAKFEVKNFQSFFIYRLLWTLTFLQGGSGHQLFLVTLILR